MATTVSPAQTQVSVAREDLREALRSVELAGGTGAFIHLRSKADHIELRTYERGLHLRYRLAVKGAAAGLEAEIALAPLKKALGAFAKEDVLELGSADGGLELRCGRRRIEIPAHDQEPLPAWPRLSGKSALASSSVPSDLARAFEMGVICAGKDEVRPLLNAVLLDFSEQALIATDSYRLLVHPAPLDAAGGEPAEDVVLPLICAKVIAKDFARRPEKVVFSRAANGLVAVKQGPVEMIVQPVVGQYPDWRTLMPPESKRRFSFKRAALADALKAVAAIAGSPGSNPPPARLLLGEKLSLHYKSHSGASLEEELPGEGDAGEELEIAFNPQFLQDATRVLASDEIELAAGDALRPGLFGDGSVRLLLMPVRLPSDPSVGS